LGGDGTRGHDLTGLKRIQAGEDSTWLVFNRRISSQSVANCENAPELNLARARVGSLPVMKRNISRSGIDLKGFQPLHFIWQP
jgi:hypothetical protein